MSMSKLMSEAWPANMFSMVGHVLPNLSTVPRTASSLRIVRRVSEFSIGRMISVGVNDHSSTWTAVDAP